MKRRNLISPLVLLSGLFIVMFMVSCSKEGGAGPEGPAGPAGPVGPEGPKGDNASGTVIYSDWLDVAFKPDTIHRVNGVIDTVGYYTTIDAPKLTKALLTTADVKVFVNSNNAGDPVINPLPFSAPSGVSITILAYTQKIQLYSNVDAGTAIANDGTRYQQYRYMIIPGNAPARLDIQVNWSDYAAVKAYLGLKD